MEPETQEPASRPQPSQAAVALINYTIWRLIWIGLGTTLLVLAVMRARGLVSMLVIAFFFSIAMDPAVSALRARRGWRRGAATGAVFAGVIGSVLLLFAVLIPALVQVAGDIAARLPQWLENVEDALGRTGWAPVENAERLEATVTTWLQEHALDVLGLAGSGVAATFELLTIAMFTFYLTAEAPRIRRAVLVRLPPHRQQRVGWAWDTAIKQTGGYFYSRTLLMLINAALTFVVMVAVGVPWLVALPLAVFQGFFAAFIPVIGTYVGVAVPALVVLGTEGVWQAVVLVGWTVLYQQVENMWLSPTLSSRTMELNGGIAFGSALAGGAVAGPMGAFMAMPVAALVVSFVSSYSRRYPLAYRSPYDEGPAEDDGPVVAPETSSAAPPAVGGSTAPAT